MPEGTEYRQFKELWALYVEYRRLGLGVFPTFRCTRACSSARFCHSVSIRNTEASEDSSARLWFGSCCLCFKGFSKLSCQVC